MINVIDETAPEFVSVPADQDLNSLYDLQDPEDLEATDNCDGEVTISFNEERTQDGCGLRIERTWTAVDECDNSTSVTQIINVGLELDIDVKVLNHISCNGDSDGSAEVIGSDATGSATYKWDNGETGKIATALSAGTHRVTVTSSEGCEKILSVNITEPDALKVDVRKLADVNCGTGELGRAIAEPSGGTSPYSYAWSNGNDNQEADNLSAGVHTVTVTDANGCTAKGYVTISDEIRCNAALGDFVWEDLDRDGIQEAGEPGIPGVLVRLLTQSGEEIASAITDENGMYMFSDLAPGNYIIEFAVPDGFTPTLNDRGSDDTVDSDANKSTGRSPVITLAEGESNKTIDAGYYQNGSIGDFVWNDLDKDGIQDTGEPGKTNVRVILMDDVGNEIASTFTNANGEYLFNNIPPDKYFVKIEANANTVISPKDAGNDDNVDSDVNPNTGISDLIMLASGENIRNLDIGCYVDEVIDLELTKTVDNDRPEANEMVMFTIMVTNKGPSAATGVAVEDVVPNGYSDIISISNSGGATGNVITWSGITLETGESIALRFRVVALAFDESLDYKNVAQVTAADQTDSDSTPNNDDGDQSEDDEDSAKVIPGGEDLIDLELAKSVDDDHVEVGQIITYEVIVYNTSNTTATGIMVKDDIPSILSITEISDDGELTGRAIIWDFGTIEPGESKQVWYRAKVLEPIGTATSYKNVAQVINADQPDVDSAPNNDDGDQSEDDEDYVIITVKPQISELIDLALDKRVSKNIVVPGETFTYYITIANESNNDATGVALQDVCPEGIADITNISDGGVLTDKTITWTGFSIAAGETIEVSFDAKVVNTNANNGFKNVSQVTAADQQDVDSTPNNDNGDQSEDDEDFEFVSINVDNSDKIDLELIKRVNRPIPKPGEVVTFRISVLNVSKVEATGVAVQDVLPNGFTNIANVSDGGVYDGNTVTWTGLSVGAFDMVRLTYDAETVDPEAGISYKNVAQVTAADQEDMDSTPNNDDGDQSEDDEDSINTVPQEANLCLEKDVSDRRPDIRDEITYTLTITNKGPEDASGIAVTDYLPIKYCREFRNISNGGVFLGETIVWTDLVVPANTSKTLTFDAVVSSSAFGKDVINLAEISLADQFDPNSTPDNLGENPVEDDEAEVTFTVGKISDLELSKSISAEIVDANQIVSFAVTLKNNGPDDVAYAEVTDRVPDGYADYSNVSHGGKIIRNEIVWSVVDLKNGEEVKFTFDARVVHFIATECDYRNIAEVSESTNVDPDSAPDNDDGDQSEDDEAFAEATLVLGSSNECLKINTALLLEGPYNSVTGEMNTKLNDLGYLPGQDVKVYFGIRTQAGQPYSVSPWKYKGEEGDQFDSFADGVGGDAGYPVDATDWVLVSLRSDVSEESTVCQTAALLLKDGTVQIVDGFNCCDIDQTKRYYIVIEHRNHLLVMSHVKLPVVNGEISYDFRLHDSYTALVGVGQKEIAPGRFVMYAGNGDQTTSGPDAMDINVKDLKAWIIDDGLNSSYFLRDYDMNGDVNVQDKGLMLKNNGLFSDVPIQVK